ncbi:XcmI [Planktothrix serta PCC 8927]|uniref:XcmI n=1 Tax=Planktothrix serta PCC 8927 TaxID=671068 RepID=A0A7Z9BQU5_9CYAN|nr:hypothetical protein [Planktothrix serta]VXD20433.1 XcmI [Planktothrix serta PCC 8927]
MTRTPPDSLIQLVHQTISKLLEDNPAATSSEAYVQHYMQFEIIRANVTPRYYLRIGINYHGQQVQHIRIDSSTGRLIGWNPSGDALGTRKNAKVQLANVTIFDRDPHEPMMNDAKIGGGEIPEHKYIRVEFKARGWLGQTKNLAGKELEKDLDLLKEDKADLLVICLSETAHRKWRGEGKEHQMKKRTGVERFKQILVDVNQLSGTNILRQKITFEDQSWVISTQKVIGSLNSIMPGAEHYITLCWTE